MSNLQGTEYENITKRLIEDPEVIFSTRDAARRFLEAVFENYTQDAEDQLVEVFVPCLRIMCERPWDPHGGTWRESGIFGALTDCRKKFKRFWYRSWTKGERHDDSGIDLINYVGFAMRSDPRSRWGEWGEPAQPEEPQGM